jgi:polyphenol oxidase
MMHVVATEGVSYLVFEHLRGQAALRHGFSVRGTAVEAESTPVSPLAWGDFSSRQGDVARRNREHFCAALGLDAGKLARTQQVHGSTVAVVRDGGSVCAATDGLCTDVPGASLLLLGADCPLVLVFDPARPAVGAAHAGWRGTVERISARLVEKMAVELGCEPAGMYGGIAPGICGKCYRVGLEVVQVAEKNLRGCAEFIRKAAGEGQDERWFFDLAEANRQQLLAAGLPAAHVEKSDCCTFEQAGWFHSYRREGEQAGRNALLAGLVNY